MHTVLATCRQCLWPSRPLSVLGAVPRAAAMCPRAPQSRRSTHHAAARPPKMRMAVVGSGPAGFYTAYRVMGKLADAHVDMYEALPVPFGLVRFGVAPDHPEVKNCQEKFAEVAAAPGFRFVGNVAVATAKSAHDNPDGASVPLAALARHYDAIVFAYGAARDGVLGVPGEDLRGIYGARSFVGWYNGLPGKSELGDALAADLARADTAVVIGQGNVALDVARMLLTDAAVLRTTDMADAAVTALASSRIRRVHVVGRRGPMQAAFTVKEARELMRLPGVAIHPVDLALMPRDPKVLPRARRRLMEVVAKGSATPLANAFRTWSLDFCLTPTAFVPASKNEHDATVGTVTFAQTRLSDPMDPNARAEAVSDDSAEPVNLPADLVFRAIGYRSDALDGFDALGIPFDNQRGVIRNDGLGRVQRDVRCSDGAMASGTHPGFYCAGWVKRGPTGVIASTMEDAFATADAIVRDWQDPSVPFLHTDGSTISSGWDGVRSEVDTNDVRVVSWQDWQRIEQAEMEAGHQLGKPRRKLTNTADMLAVLG